MYSEISKLAASRRVRILCGTPRQRRFSKLLTRSNRILESQLIGKRRLPQYGIKSSNLHQARLSSLKHPPNRLSSVMALSSVELDTDDDDDEETAIIAQSAAQMFPRTRLSSLDLELGEACVWEQPETDDDLVDDDLEELQSHHPRTNQQQSQRTAQEILRNFDPQNPPTSNVQELQLWLECLAQQEAVERYQKVLDSARERKDYAALSVVQRQILEWFPVLCEEIQKRQDAYVYNKKADGDETNRALKRYGPFLCTLSPEKLAVIAAHASIMHALDRSGRDGMEGVPFVSMAKRIGEAVEEEVLIHRVLHLHFFEEATKKSGIGEDDDNISHLLTAESLPEESGEVAESLSGDSQDGSVDARKDKALLWSYSSSHLRRYMDSLNRYQASSKKHRGISYAVRRAKKLLETDTEWADDDKIHLGAALLQLLLMHTPLKTRDANNKMAFTYEKKWVQKDKVKVKSFIYLNDDLYKMIVSDQIDSLGVSTTRYKPMIVPPKPWRALDDGAYLWLKADLLRFHGCRTQEEALKCADLTTVFDGLNALGKVGWRINKRVLSAAQYCWDNDIPLGDIPSRKDFEVPAEPLRPEWTDLASEKEGATREESLEAIRRYRDELAKFKRIRQKNMDLRSLRCSAILKLDQAIRFRDFERIYFPYNMDFRGRAYPIPPHLSNVGSDLCRGMLMFADGKPLGPRGLYWLKVHLANFAGKDKMTFDDRAAFVDNNIDNVRQSAADPFGGDRWWMSLEDPFQGLATCIEIANAIDLEDPESYVCHLAVHMDGSCNGLQHYAALGRDLVGGKAVNLCATDEPQDVYVGVMHEVIRRVAEEASRTVEFDTSDIDSLSKKQKKALNNNRSAKLVNGLIDRGVVKRTVMTSVYGVTYIGARQQIQEKIEEKLESKGHDIDEMAHDIFMACGYLARVTMDVMGDLFSGAKGTMNWLTTCARLIAQHNAPVAWVTPIGLPAIQPYRQKKYATLVTLLQSVTLASESDDLPIHKQRQVSAFPPNYVHSLDSSHMLLTALEMEKRKLTFSAVHDSFWTHACDVDEMNDVLRGVFIDLYEQPLLERLKESWELRYPDLTFPDLPERGSLRLSDVRKAPYFFQ